MLSCFKSGPCPYLYRRIFVYTTFCVINVCLSLSDDANKIKTLIIEGAVSQLLMADISFNIACKELKIAQIAQLNQLFQLLHLVFVYGHGFYELSRMLMRKNVSSMTSTKIRLFNPSSCQLSPFHLVPVCLMLLFEGHVTCHNFTPAYMMGDFRQY